MKTYLFNSMLLIVFLLYSPILFSQSINNSEDILKVANTNLSNFLNIIPYGRESDIGCNSREDFPKIRIGDVYQILTIDQSFFKNDNNNIELYLMPTLEWSVGLKVNGVIKTLLSIAQIHSELQTVSIGGSILAQNIYEIENDFNLSSNLKRFIIRLFTLNYDFLLFSDAMNNNQFIVPLNSAIISNTVFQRRIYQIGEFSKLLSSLRQ